MAVFAIRLLCLFHLLPEKLFSFPHITNNFHTFWANDRKSTKYAYVSCRELCLAIDFLIDNIYVRFGNSVFRQLIGIPMGTNSAPLLADLFLHTFEYDFMLRTMKQDMTKAVQFSNTFRYIDDLLSVNNENFGNYISDIYPSDLELKDTTLTSNAVCFLDTRIKNGDSNTPFHLSVYDKRDDFSFTRQSGLWPMAYGYVRICTSKLDFIHRFRRLSSRLLHQGFKGLRYFVNRLLNSSNATMLLLRSMALHYGKLD